MHIVAVVDSEGRLSAGTRPKVHPTKELAVDEAQRLSKTSVGSEYLVFSAAASVKTEAVYSSKVVELGEKNG